jgi:(3,5-dihydroxyphenyl)acetyl-CoA 1,2-dioxygenase
MDTLKATGLAADEIQAWRASTPAFAPPGRNSAAALAADADRLRRHVERGETLLARLPDWPARTIPEQTSARAVREALRAVRLAFLRVHAGGVYAALTGDFARFPRVDELCYAAAERYPGLVPTRAAVLAERGLAQKDKDAGLELDQGLFLSKVLDDPRAGAHLIHAMRRPAPASIDRLADFRARGEADLGVAHVARHGVAGVVELRNLRYLNAEDNAAVEALEIAVDLVLLDPDIEVGILRGGVVDHPKHAGRRIFQAGANLTHLYYGQIGLIEFFATRELGYINKMYRGLTGPDFVPDEAETSDEKPWIAAVESFAIGGGCQITLVCDRVLCEEGAYFSLPARKEGFLPGAANLRLAGVAGERAARQAILFDRVFDARQAEAAGLCDVVVPRGEMDDALARAVREATEGGAVAVAGQRKALRIGAEPLDTFRRYMALYVREQAACMYSEGLIANLERYWNAQQRAL